MRQKRTTLRHRLRDKNAIKRIAMNRRQSLDNHSMASRHWQLFKPGLDKQLARFFRSKRDVVRFLTMLNANFPNRRRAEEIARRRFGQQTPCLR